MRNNCLEKDIVQGTSSGKRKRGKPQTTWLGYIVHWTNMYIERVLRVTDNRNPRRRTIHDAVNPRIEDD